MNENIKKGATPTPTRVKKEAKPAPGRYLRKKEKRRLSKKARKLIALCSVVILIVALAAMVMQYSATHDALRGTWDYDGTTVYKFNGDGTGALVLPDSQYDFSYSISRRDHTVAIDFMDDSAKDHTYSFAVEGDQLTLTDTVGDESVSYTLTNVNN